MTSPILTLREACAYLKRGRSWLLEHADEIGVIRSGAGGKLSFRQADLDAWLTSHRVQKVAAQPAEPTPIRTVRSSQRTGLNPVTKAAWSGTPAARAGGR